MIHVPIDWQDPATALLALLFCGHLFADFLFQSNRLAEAKKCSESHEEEPADRSRV